MEEHSYADNVSISSPCLMISDRSPSTSRTKRFRFNSYLINNIYYETLILVMKMQMLLMCMIVHHLLLEQKGLYLTTI